MLKKKLILVLVALVLGFSVPLPFHSCQASEANIYVQLQSLIDVMNYIKSNYVEETAQSELVDGAIDGVLRQLDPHCYYLKPRELSNMAERLRGDFEGIGIMFDIRDGVLTVIAPIEGSPADRVGLKAGDKIVKIDGKTALGITTQEVYQKLRGPRGTKVNVSVKREGEEELLEFAIVRDKIPIYSIPSFFMLTSEIGYIWVARFSQRTDYELEKALRQLESQGMKKLVLDLRWNGGGPLLQAVKVADKFIKSGRICYTQGRTSDSTREYYATEEGTHPYFPLIVLINHASASASEIVAGAIQDCDRGLVVGRTSFGKGLVQGQFKLRNGGAIFLTIAHWYTPSGRLIQRPYRNKSRADYVAEAFRDTSSNGNEAKPVFYTLKGRKVYGGGGITPDIVLKGPSSGKLQRKLRDRNAFFDFAAYYLGTQPQVPENFDQFHQNFQVDDSIILQFKDFLFSRKIGFSPEDFQHELGSIKNSIKAEIAGELWGAEEKYQIYLEKDPEVLQTIELFDKAEQLLAE
ncbi:MAG: S41 family peptidase [Candidatus Latescibacteria bacterium]|nr:S41 family peptidase [Candidatus Latescibacterota bacterium]